MVAELGRLAVCAWSPGGGGGGFIASGSYASSADGSIGTPSTLEILSLDLQGSKLVTVVTVPVSDKFCSIDWGLPSRAHPAGLIAGGLSDGTVRVWDAATLMRSGKGKGDENTAVVFGGTATAKKHAGPVKSLAFNPFMIASTRLASGGADGQVLVWDLSNPSAGATAKPPAGHSTVPATGQREEVTAVSWNRKVQHILGTATNSGVLNVWDLKQSKQVISIRNPRGRLRCSSLAWHPDIPTQIIIACDQDEATGAVLYDLRNASAPVSAYTHHNSHGVSSTSWCPHDSDLLLTSSQDSRTVVVSVASGEIVSEAPPAASGNFDVKWSSRLPGLYLASTFDGRITVNSMMTATTAPSVSSETVNALAESFGEMAGGFQSGAVPTSPTTERPRITYNVSRPPKWLKRPVSVSFAFGGRIASMTSANGGKVNIESVSESFDGLKESVSKLDEMLMDLTSDDPSPALQWCKDASAAAKTPGDKMAWDALAIMFQTDSRRSLLRYLGYEVPALEAGDDIAMPVHGLSQSLPLSVPVRSVPRSATDVLKDNIIGSAEVDSVANGTSGMNLEGPAPWEVAETAVASGDVNDSILDGDDTANGKGDDKVDVPNGFSSSKKEDAKVKSFAGKSRDQIDALVKHSVIVGDFKTAVEACLHVGRTADALIIAHAGGPDLWLHTQAEYISAASVSSDSNIIGAIAGPKSRMDAYISDAAEAGKDSWKEALAVILTYSTTEDVTESCSALGKRLLIANNHSAALFCFICAGDTRMATTVWMRDRPTSATTICAMMADRIERIGILVQKVRMITSACVLGAGEREIGAVKAMDEVSGSVICEFGALLAAQGDASLAVTYLSNLDAAYTCAYGSAELIREQAAECLVMADEVAAAPVGTNGSMQPGHNAFNPTYNNNASYGYSGQNYGAPNPGYGAVAPPPNNWSSNYAAPPAQGHIGGYSQSVPPPIPTAPLPALYSQPVAPLVPTAAVPAPPRPVSMFTPQTERSSYNASDAYAAAPQYGQAAYQPPMMPAVSAAPPPPPPMVGSLGQQPSVMPAAPPAPVGFGGGLGAGGIVPMAPTMGAINYDGQGGYGGLNMQAGSLGVMGQAAPAPPPPSDGNGPPPMSYHAKARPGSGASLPPSAEVAVAEGRRSKPISSSGMPGGPRRSGSNSSSLSALGVTTVFLEKAESSKVPAEQQVIVKSLKGAYSYALRLNESGRYKKKMEDVSKRLGRLVAGLNAGLVSSEVVVLLLELGKSIEKRNYEGASVVVQTLTKKHWDSNSQWIQGVKRLIDCVVTGR